MCILLHSPASASLPLDRSSAPQLALSLAQSIAYGHECLQPAPPAFGSASARSQCTKEAASQRNDLHSLLSSTFPEVPRRLVERTLASPFLTNLPNLDLLKRGPRNGATLLPR